MFTCTVNREDFVVEIFSDTLAWLIRKLNTRIPMCTINGNVVQGSLSEYYLTRKIIARNILGTKYFGHERITIYINNWLHIHHTARTVSELCVLAYMHVALLS